jgi:hypothetical protein
VLVPPDDPTALARGVLAALDTMAAAPPSIPPISSFADVATAHLEVFERALARRGSVPHPVEVH